ncbi:MAG: nucleoside phosphorylase [Candidatus Helarchaeota archaeon]
MPIFRTIKNYLLAYLVNGVLRFMSQDSKIVYLVLNCRPRKIAPRVLLPATDYVIQQIEKQFKTKPYGKTGLGSYKGVPISVVSSGMGAPITAMVMEALKRAKVQYVIRVDYCGGLLQEMEIGDVVLCSEARCGDVTTPHYLLTKDSYPTVKGNEALRMKIKDQLKTNGIEFHEGGIWTHDAIFREPLELLERAKEYNTIAIDMETSVVFALGELFDIATASILIVTDKPDGRDIDHQDLSLSPRVFQQMEKIIHNVLEVLAAIEP